MRAHEFVVWPEHFARMRMTTKEIYDRTSHLDTVCGPAFEPAKIERIAAGSAG